MANRFFKKTWFRFGVVLIFFGGAGFGIFQAIAPKSSHQVLVSSLPPEALQIVSYRSPTCGCCGEWVKHMKAQGFKVTDHQVEDIDGVKREHNVPEDLAACHTAIASGYIIEGHIPAMDVKRLLAEKPDVAGIAVPGMPIGSPGMESGNIKEPYTVFTFDQTGQTSVFQQHNS